MFLIFKGLAKHFWCFVYNYNHIIMSKLSFNYIVLMLIVAVFGLQYYLSSNYIEKAFQHSTYENRTNALENEITQFKEYFAYRLTVIIMQCVGIFLCLNIGFLYFNLTIRFKDIVHLVVICLFAIIIHHVLCLVLIKLNNWMFVTSSVNAISEKLSLANYIKSTHSSLMQTTNFYSSFWKTLQL